MNYLLKFFFLVFILLSGCSNNMDELDFYVNQIKARPGGRIEALPEITTYEVYSYKADEDGLRSPFVPDSKIITQVSNQFEGARPDPKRNREHLESFSLDTLRMVGTLQLEGNYYGLVQTTDGLVHRVIKGNYVGQNEGQIISIRDSEILIVEIISNGIGGYIEREAALSLIGQ